MKNAVARLGAISLSWCLLSAAALAQTYETIDPPQSGGTQPAGVHKGTVVGSYYDTVTGRNTGFSFSRSEGYQVFEAPNVEPSVGTYAIGSDDFGRVAGWFAATDYHTRSFVRSRSGTITLYEVPKKDVYTTYTFDMNGPGSVIGQYFLSTDSATLRGYVRAPNGVVQTLKIPGNEVMLPWTINDAGTIAGFFAETFDAEWTGFIRAAHGTYTTFAAAPGCGFGGGGPTLVMNSKGDLAGTCGISSSSFLRKQNGQFVIIDYPAALETRAYGIAANGDVSGYFTDTDFGVHGFIRRANGTLESFDFPGAVPGTTQVSRMDDNGDIVGTYYDAGVQLHGFIRYEDCD